MDGMTLLKKARKHYPETEIVVLTAHATVGTAVEAMKHGAFDYLQKPLKNPDSLRLIVSRALERRRLRDHSQVARSSASRSPLLAVDPNMRALRLLLEKVAPTNATVLLLGESGTGKEVAAREIHRLSGRADRPFVAINCAAVSEQLVESEMFGHKRGAFTGATERRRGRFELADGGTLFLDEVAELSLAIQAKLLRVIEERNFERVGGMQTIAVDVRLIAATNANLATTMEEGSFREDLYHRLSVFPAFLPPLRERQLDIAPLAVHLLQRASAQLNAPGRCFSDAATAKLRGYSQGVRRYMMRIRRVMAVCGRFAGRRPVAARRDDESVIWMDPYG
ncbi:MAG: sigma-54 dependent transcriptional regulator, partial [Nannocystaceae bacterium]